VNTVLKLLRPEDADVVLILKILNYREAVLLQVQEIIIYFILKNGVFWVLTRATRRNIPEDTILHSHRRENLKSYIFYIPLRFFFCESKVAHVIAHIVMILLHQLGCGQKIM
jgi:hypothetical protein